MAFDGVPEDVKSAATDIATFIECQSDDLIHPDVKQTIADVRVSQEGSSDPATTLALLRSIGNIYRSLGRALKRRYEGTTKHAADTFDKTAGAGIGHVMAILVVGV